MQSILWLEAIFSDWVLDPMAAHSFYPRLRDTDLEIRQPGVYLRAFAINSANSGRTVKGSNALTVARPGLPTGRRPLRWPRGTNASLSNCPATSGQSRVRTAKLHISA